MKKLITFSFALFLSINLIYAKDFIKAGSLIPASDTIVGYFHLNQLRDLPYSSWFNLEYEDYSVDTLSLHKLNKETLGNVTITIVLGTWCSDSQRETPRFVKILEYFNFDLDNITAIGVNREKQAPNTEVNELNIDYVPTIIFFRDNKEIGRIVESPEESLEKDMVKILSSN